jgi:hypothetical protein
VGRQLKSPIIRDGFIIFGFGSENADCVVHSSIAVYGRCLRADKRRRYEWYLHEIRRVVEA